MRFAEILDSLRASSNLRQIPGAQKPGMVDLSSNDYLGLARRRDLADRFLAGGSHFMTASASRLLAGHQEASTALENLLEHLYGRPALLFNSGYHANTGIIGAIANDGKTLIIADKLVHASAIDGIRLSGAPFERFRHNDLRHLVRLLEKYRGKYETVLVIVESVYSMDGDRADIDALIDIKRSMPGIMLYVDEAHAVGVEGEGGLGLVSASKAPGEVDIVVGTLGKALASCGAYCIADGVLKEFLVNRARSLIFSTALPPIVVEWSRLMIEQALTMDTERQRLAALGRHVANAVGVTYPSHILPYMTHSAARALELSADLEAKGFKVLPIRTPTVPPGTERLRISLCATLTDDEINRFINAIAG